MSVKLLVLVKGGPGSGNFGHAGIPGSVGGSAASSGRSPSTDIKVPKKATPRVKREFTDDDYNDAVSDVNSIKKSLRRSMRAASSNKLTVTAAKQVAKERKMKVANILARITPSDNISGDVTWDSSGSIGKVR